MRTPCHQDTFCPRGRNSSPPRRKEMRPSVKKMWFQSTPKKGAQSMHVPSEANAPPNPAKEREGEEPLAAAHKGTGILLVRPQRQHHLNTRVVVIALWRGKSKIGSTPPQCTYPSRRGCRLIAVKLQFSLVMDIAREVRDQRVARK